MLIADDDLLALPDGIDPVTAAAVGNSGTAAYLPLVETVRMRPGETVLVLGATGSVGQLAVQVAHTLGAGRVIAAGRDRETLDRLLSLGADAVVDLRSGESPDELAARLEPVTGPVDVVFDCVFGMPFEAALRVCARGARLVNVGHGAGAETVVPAGLLRGKQLTISGFAGIHTTLHDKEPALTWLWSALQGGQLSVTPHTFEFDDLSDVWRAQASSPHAKFVLVPGNGDL